MSLFNKHFWKFFIGLLVMVVLGLLVAYGTNWYSDYKKFGAERERQEAQRAESERIKKLYESDTYGGKTPEETLALFIDALKKGDTDLAAKYFVIEKQEEMSKNLQKIKDANQLALMAKDLMRPVDKKNIRDTQIVLYIYNDLNQLAVAIHLGRGPNEVWKIINL